jgi:hypothetical protein
MKKIVGLVIMACVLPTAIFAQRSGEHRHEPLDMLIGINLGVGGALVMKDVATENPNVSYIFASDIGVTCDFYFFNWLSVTTGLFFHPQVVAIYKPEYAEREDIEVTDYMQTPLCLTIPLQTHINVPGAEWLYVGVGLHLNIPLTSMTAEAAKTTGLDMPDSKGNFFVSMPVDLGFDLIRSRDGGGRFIFRFTPTFLEQGTLLPIGVMWQIYNFRLGA